MKTIERVRRTAVSTNEWERLRNVGRTHDQRGTLASAPSGRRMVAYGDCCGASSDYEFPGDERFVVGAIPAWTAAKPEKLCSSLGYSLDPLRPPCWRVEGSAVDFSRLGDLARTQFNEHGELPGL